MKVVKALALLSLINIVFEFFLKSIEQDGGIKKKSLTMRNFQNRPEKIQRLISMHIRFFIILKSSKVKSQKLVTKVRENFII